MNRNPLAREACAPGNVVRSIVSERASYACRELSPRHAAILLRVDVARHAAAAVASDLGVSLRQFHRERRTAHEGFVRRFRGVRTWLRVDDDFPRRLLAHATALADSGEAATSRALLDDVARRAGPSLRCEAHARLCRVETEVNHFQRARRHLLAGKALIEELRYDMADTGGLRDAVEAASLALLAAESGPAAVPSSQHGGAESLVVRATAAVRSGDAVRALRLLRLADASGALSIEANIDRLWLQGEIADFLNGDISCGRRYFEDAIAMARRHGFQGRARYAEHQLRSARWMRTRNLNDARAYRQLSDQTDLALPARLRTSLALCAADIETAIGRPHRALTAARMAECTAATAYERLSAQALASGAMLRMGLRQEARLKAEIAADQARTAAHPRIVSLAQRICAEVYLAQGNRRAAHGAIEESIDCARRFSSAHVYAQTQALLGRIARTRT